MEVHLQPTMLPQSFLEPAPQSSSVKLEFRNGSHQHLDPAKSKCHIFLPARSSRHRESTLNRGTGQPALRPRARMLQTGGFLLDNVILHLTSMWQLGRQISKMTPFKPLFSQIWDSPWPDEISLHEHSGSLKTRSSLWPTSPEDPLPAISASSSPFCTRDLCNAYSRKLPSPDSCLESPV